MGPRQRREREKEILRQEILDAARDLFVAEGYEQVSMRRIAEKIEYSPTTIYLYFKDKWDLLFSICEETFTRLSETLEQTFEKNPDPLVRLKLGCRAYVDFGIQHPNHYRVTFIDHHHHQLVNVDQYMRVDSAGLKTYNYLRACVVQSMEENRIRQGDADMISQGLWSTVHGVTALLITKPHFPWVERERLIDFVIDTAIAGLAIQ